MKIKPIACTLASAAGAEIAEAALVLPLVFMLLLGIVWFGRAFNIYSTITQAAQQGAIKAARPFCATCGNNFPDNFAVRTSVDAVLAASNLDSNQILNNANPPAPLSCVNPPATCQTTSNHITICRQVLLNASTATNQPPQCGVLVSFQYPFQLYLPFTSLNLQQVVMTAQAQSRMEN
jgi:Flp pilus assembly protein TadG